MKRKTLLALIIACSMATVGGCGTKEESESKPPVEEQETVEQQDTETEQESEQTKSERDLPEGEYQDTGSGTMFLATSGGTSENGNIPVIYVSDEILLQIELDTLDFDSSKLSYIYIDGMLYGKEQLGESQIPLDLSADSLSVGKHSVEVLQYEGDSPENAPITYKSASYEIKSK